MKADGLNDPELLRALEHLLHFEALIGRVEEHLQGSPRRREEATESDDGDPPVLQAMSVARKALAALGDFLRDGEEDGEEEEAHRPGGQRRIALKRSLSGVTLYAAPECCGEAASAERAAFIAELRRRDQRLLDSAELLGLLLGLGAKWAMGGLALPAVLLSLRDSAPRILELGRRLASD